MNCGPNREEPTVWGDTPGNADDFENKGVAGGATRKNMKTQGLKIDHH
jgi:hypothetical protein